MKAERIIFQACLIDYLISASAFIVQLTYPYQEHVLEYAANEDIYFQSVEYAWLARLAVWITTVYILVNTSGVRENNRETVSRLLLFYVFIAILDYFQNISLYLGVDGIEVQYFIAKRIVHTYVIIRIWLLLRI